MHSRARLIALLYPLFVLAACGPSGQQRTSQRLDNRLLRQLEPDIKDGRAVLQPLPSGARVTLLGPSSFVTDEQALDDQQRDVRAGIVEGMLDPSLMRVDVTDTSTLPADQRDARVGNVRRYFAEYGLASTLLPASPSSAPPAGTVPAGAVPIGTGPAGATSVLPGLAVTINVICPPVRPRIGYGSGQSMPVCD